MKIIISPAKKMRVDNDYLDFKELPVFLMEAQKILDKLKSMSFDELRKLWKCNDSIAEENFQRILHMDLKRNLTPAILAYDGIQFQYMAPGVFENKHFEYIQNNLRILSGFYGILKPLDGVALYRLEMQAKISIDNSKNLYDFWEQKVCSKLYEDENTIINLASKEYSSLAKRLCPSNVRFIDVIFGEQSQGKIIEKGTMCKMARGRMVRFMAENAITDSETLKGFGAPDYEYSEKHSDDCRLVFIKK